MKTLCDIAIYWSFRKRLQSRAIMKMNLALTISTRTHMAAQGPGTRHPAQGPTELRSAQGSERPGFWRRPSTSNHVDIQVYRCLHKVMIYAFWLQLLNRFCVLISLLYRPWKMLAPCSFAQMAKPSLPANLAISLLGGDW